MRSLEMGHILGFDEGVESFGGDITIVEITRAVPHPREAHKSTSPKNGKAYHASQANNNQWKSKLNLNDGSVFQLRTARDQIMASQWILITLKK